MKLKYEISEEIKKLGINKIAVAEIYDVSIKKSNDNLEKIKEEAVNKILKLSDESINTNEILESYRELVRNISRSLKKFPPAAESLINLTRRNGKLPQINTAVDSYNVVVLEKYLALGVHDIDKLGSKITFKLSEGNEPFIAVGSDKEKFTQKGDFVYSDENQVLAWLDSKDSDKVKLSESSKNIVIIIQGTHITNIDYTIEVVKIAAEIIVKFCGGRYETKIIE
ncbi:hypothetical protein HOC29_03965 [archaeon]|jgi:DNA/RNA-binding domain of Phe-tRNA-synthetase-like protein|nr:hypothetical protein [archaeon]MBT3720495.1 hypothetical protein [archaeon]MBT4532148.1 hypothetical protein [archaeon]